ncbi:MAG TPA: hypothetical protein VFJ16_16210 [Longimicrobium sp.]|nr:hypothetical protein [Longimicrobium sp.]
MSLSVEQIQVVSFETTATEADAVAQPAITAPQPNCYSPLCIPTDLPEQCPDKFTNTCA